MAVLILGRDYLEILNEHRQEVTDHLQQFIEKLTTIDHSLSDARSQSMWAISEDIKTCLQLVDLTHDGDEKFLKQQSGKISDASRRLGKGFQLLEPYICRC